MTCLFVNRLTIIDFSYLDRARGLVGESWLVDVELSGSLDHQGMVLDFGAIKRDLRTLIDREFDHRLLLPAACDALTLDDSGNRLGLTLKLDDGGRIIHASPASAVTAIDSTAITPETVAAAITARLKPQLPDNVESVAIRLYPESIDGPYYQYSHGLKHHDGNCQRIAHGHRSRLRIERDGQPDQRTTADWAAGWRDIYIGTRADLQEDLLIDGIEHLRFGYTARQGLFELTLPASRCYLIDTDSTVENIAAHIAATLAERQPAGSWRVFAYEGIDKGAVGRAG